VHHRHSAMSTVTVGFTARVPFSGFLCPSIGSRAPQFLSISRPTGNLHLLTSGRNGHFCSRPVGPAHQHSAKMPSSDAHLPQDAPPGIRTDQTAFQRALRFSSLLAKNRNRPVCDTTHARLLLVSSRTEVTLGLFMDVLLQVAAGQIVPPLWRIRNEKSPTHLLSWRLAQFRRGRGVSWLSHRGGLTAASRESAG
jgi:hypothetical protein